MDLREQIKIEKQKIEQYENSDEYKLKKNFTDFCYGLEIEDEYKEKIIDELQNCIDKKSYKESVLYNEIKNNMHRKELPLELKIAFEELKKFKNNLEKTEKYNFDYDIENEFHKFENNLEKTAEYHFDYADENKFHKLERSLKKFNMLAYKKLYFYYYPSLKSGNFLGELVSTNEEKNIQTYELKLPTEPVFSAVHGDIKLIYTVYKNEKIVMLNTITPEDILTEGSQSELVTYKGVMVSKEHSEKDLFKINLLNMLNK